MSPSYGLLALLIPVVAALALFGRPYALLLLGLALPSRGGWSLAGLRLDPADLVFAGILVTYLLRPGIIPRGAFRQVPLRGVWLAIGLIVTLAYFVHPASSEHITDPARALYQVYRYCWKPLLYYPLTCMLIGDNPHRRWVAIAAIIVGGDVLALDATIEGYTRPTVRGLLGAKNALGGALIIPLIFAALSCFSASSRRRFAFSLASLLLISRGLLFSSSRGAFVAAFAGLAVMALLMFGQKRSRRALFQMAGLACAGFVVLVMLKPDVLMRPNVRHMFSATQGTQDSNFQWRLEQRWPHFWAMAVDNPWLGVGTHVDESLNEDGANTPHNGYLSILVTHGFPVGMLYLVFALSALRGAYLVGKRAREPADRMFGYAALAAIVCFLVHNIVESTIMIPFVRQTFWAMLAVTLTAAQGVRYAPAAKRVLARKRATHLRPVLHRGY